MKNQVLLIHAQMSCIAIEAGIKWDESAHSRSDDGRFGKGGQSKSEEGNVLDKAKRSGKGAIDKLGIYLGIISEKPHPQKAAQRILEYAKAHPGQVAIGAIAAAVSLLGVSQLGKRLLKQATAGGETVAKVGMNVKEAEEIPTDVSLAYLHMRDKLKVELFNREEAIQHLKYEELHAFDEAGESIFSTKGGAQSVEISPNQMKDAQAHPTGLFLTHNHPHIKLSDGTEATSSFSISDVNTALALRLKEMRAVTDEHIYILRPGTLKDRFESITQVEASRIGDIMQSHVQKGQEKYNKGSASLASLEHQCFHNVWTEVSKEMPHIMSYKRITK